VLGECGGFESDTVQEVESPEEAADGRGEYESGGHEGKAVLQRTFLGCKRICKEGATGARAEPISGAEHAFLDRSRVIVAETPGIPSCRQLH
jgi:hypothetical protein